MSASAINDSDQFHGRIDHQIGSNDQIFGRYSVSKGNAVTPSGLPLTGSLSDTTAHSITVQESHTFSPTRSISSGSAGPTSKVWAGFRWRIAIWPARSSAS